MKTASILLLVIVAGIAHAQSAKTPTNSTEQDLPVYVDPQPNNDGLPLLPKPGQPPTTAPDSIRPYLSGSYQEDKFIDPMIIDPDADLSDKPDAWEMKTSP